MTLNYKMLRYVNYKMLTYSSLSKFPTIMSTNSNLLMFSFITNTLYAYSIYYLSSLLCTMSSFITNISLVTTLYAYSIYYLSFLLQIISLHRLYCFTTLIKKYIWTFIELMSHFHFLERNSSQRNGVCH
jgi:hypothetical protein